MKHEMIIEKVYFALRMALALLLIVFLCYDRSFYKLLFVNGTSKGYFLPCLYLYICASVLYAIIFYKARKMKIYNVCLIIFFMAIVPRAILLIGNDYIPTSDFKNYLFYGQAVYYENYTAIAPIINLYQMPKMGGLALLNGFIAKLFSPTLLGFQVANILMNSISCVLLYLIIKESDINVALIAGALYAIYPSNIISSVITTNHHGALFSFLLAIYFYKKLVLNISRINSWIYLLLTSFFVLCSNFFHPSIIILLIALGIFTVFHIFRLRNNRKAALKFGISFLSIIIIFNLGTTMVNRYCYRNGIIESYQEIDILFKFAMGTDMETMGSYNKKYGDSYYKDMDAVMQHNAYKQAITQNITQAGFVNMLELLWAKTHKAWFTQDSYIRTWFRDAQNNEYNKLKDEQLLTDEMENKQQEETLVISGIAHLDTLFIQWLYIFAIAGILLKRRISTDSILNVFLLVAIGWILFIAFTEMQTRYRYSAMPSFVILGAIGVVEVYKHSKRIFAALPLPHS